jgi:mono/diheme cytochrome c family protein
MSPERSDRSAQARLLGYAFAVFGLLAGCTDPPDTASEAKRYLYDLAYRRLALRESLVNPDNGYSRLRLEHYATGRADDWDELPEWNPSVAPIASDELERSADTDGPQPMATEAALPLRDAITTLDDAALLALGRLAFARYPSQLAPQLGAALVSRSVAEQFGLWIDEERGVAGLVRARMADGSSEIALTCATCHAARGAAGVEDGKPNAEFDLGRSLLVANAALDPEFAERIALWGPGRLDVTTSDGSEPVRISDLRPVRWLTHLHHDATLVMHDRTALAIRIETLIITAHAQALRPPRVVALALATYILSFANRSASNSQGESVPGAGIGLFAQHCQSCHAPAGFTGPPVPIATIGTDPGLGNSAERGTGKYRVPSLRYVGSRGPLLHDASLPSIDALFDPARLTPEFSGRLHGSGAVLGHPFGLDLSESDRAALIRYVKHL